MDLREFGLKGLKDIQLRVEDVGKKRKRTRRKIEKAFKGLPK